MKTQLLIAMLALSSLLIIPTGVSADYRFPGEAGIMGLQGIQSDSWQRANGHERFICGFGFSVCERSAKETLPGSEITPATSGTKEGNVEFAPAVPARQEGTSEFAPAGSLSQKEYMTPKNAPYEAPAESQSY